MRLLCVVVVLAGCGPVQYISQVTRRAAAEVAAAKSAGAEKYAPYEYTAAVEFLHKAREEAGYADYQAAIRFGNKAEEHAKKAREISIKSAGREGEEGEPIDPSATPPTPDPEEPAKGEEKGGSS
jgi:hypothetical protein